MSSKCTINIAFPRGSSKDYIQTWKDYYMTVAFLASQRSKVPNEKRGACIVNQNKQIVGIGFNGPPSDCKDDINYPWSEEIGQRFLCHAAMNAIAFKTSIDVQGCTMYTTRFPCIECTKQIYQSGIKEVIYMQDHPEKSDIVKFCKDTLKVNEKTLKENEIPSKENEKPSKENEKPSKENDKPSKENKKTSKENEKTSKKNEKPSKENEKPLKEDEKSLEEDEKTLEGNGPIKFEKFESENVSFKEDNVKIF